MPTFTRKPYKYICRGLDVAHPPDLLPDGSFPILRNMRVDSTGTLTRRPPLALAASAFAQSPVLSVRRLNDPTTGGWARIATDAAGNLLYGASALAQADSGYSGNPAMLVPFRPLQSAAPFMYVYDSARTRKINAAGAHAAVGIAPPNAPPDINLGVPNYIDVADFDSAGVAPIASWVNGGTAGTPASAARFNTTISQILYDAGTGPGWVSIILAVMDSNAQPGALLRLSGTETVKVHDVFPAINSTTIAAIAYDSGSAGSCCVVLTTPTVGLARDCVVQLGAELVRVLSVTVGRDGIPSLRCITNGAHTSGEAVTGYASLRAWTQLVHLVSDTAAGVAIQSTIGIGTGTLDFAAAYNLAAAGNRPITNDDYIHLSILVDKPENIVEGRFALDIGDGAFDQNYLYYPFEASQLQANAIGGLTLYAVEQAQLQQQIIQQKFALQQPGVSPVVPGMPSYGVYPYGPTQAQIDAMLASEQAGVQALIQLQSPTAATGLNAIQAVPGGSQWTEILIPISSLIRIGTDQTKTLADVVALRIQLNVTADTVLLASSWWVGGTYGPDAGDTGTDFLATYRYRSSVTGARSNPAPQVRSGVYGRREQLVISNFAAPADPQVDTLDVFLFGGLNNNWSLVASLPLTTAFASVELTNAAVQIGEALQFDNFVPFPTTDLPRAGNCTVCGTSVTFSGGDAFNVKWTPGSAIIINSLVYTLYSSPESSSRLQLMESAGAVGATAFQVPEATLAGTPLPYACDGGNQNSNVIFAAGDPLNPGTLYWGNPNDADSASDSHNLEVTSPSEPLYTPFVWNGQAYVYSSQRLFVISPSAARGTQRVGFLAQEVPSGKGLFSPWFACVGATPVFGSESGINSFNGGASPSLTDESLLPLFPQQGVAGVTANGYAPVDYSQPSRLRLFWADSELYFAYQDTGAVLRLMRYDFSHGGGWFPYDTTPQPCCVYAEEGGELESLLVGCADGTLRQFSAIGSEAVTWQVRTACLDFGNSRSQKLGTDALLDFSGAIDSTVIYFDDFNSFVTGGAHASIPRTQIQLPLAANALILWRNIALDLQGTGAVELFEFQPAVELQPYLAPVYISQAVDHGVMGYSHLRESWMALISAAAVTLYAVVDGVPVLLCTVPSTGGLFTKTYFPSPPVKGKLFLYKAQTADGSGFTLYPDETAVMVKAWASRAAYQPYRPFEEMTSG